MKKIAFLNRNPRFVRQYPANVHPILPGDGGSDDNICSAMLSLSSTNIASHDGL